MRVRVLSSYPLVLAADGRPVESGQVIELLDAAAEALTVSGMVEPAPAAEVTAEATLVGWGFAEPEPASDTPAPAKAKRAR